VHEKNRNTTARRFVDLSYVILVVAVLIALVFIVLLSRENLKQRRVQAQLNPDSPLRWERYQGHLKLKRVISCRVLRGLV